MRPSPSRWGREGRKEGGRGVVKWRVSRMCLQYLGVQGLNAICYFPDPAIWSPRFKDWICANYDLSILVVYLLMMRPRKI